MGLLDRPSEGTVRLDGRDVGDLSDGERTRLRLMELGFVFQRFHLLPTLSAVENVALPMEAAGVPAGERYMRAAGLLESVGLAERLTFVPAQLSGGQRQRVAIARALANGPRLILADEPTGALHSEDRVHVIALLRRFQHEGRSLVVVTHDQEVAAHAERRVELRDGRVGRMEISRQAGHNGLLREQSDRTAAQPLAGSEEHTQ
jgi:ABC-type lipoprotein export system ATPase subunit